MRKRLLRAFLTIFNSQFFIKTLFIAALFSKIFSKKNINIDLLRPIYRDDRQEHYEQN